MSIDAWMTLWKIVLIGGIGGFALLAVAVTIGGFFDVGEGGCETGARTGRRRMGPPHGGRGRGGVAGGRRGRLRGWRARSKKDRQ